ncbi:MAG: YfhO family protein, partial [Ruminococcus sp.]|nr:YfhO family protein [Ruminococcus sp.]
MKAAIKKHPMIFSLALYTVLFVIFYILSLGDNPYILVEDSDIMNQTIPQALSLKRFYSELLSGNFAPMDYNVLFGSEQFFSMGMPFNPFNLILVFLPESAVIYYMKILCTVCMYAAGAGAGVLLGHMDIKPEAAALSAVMYAFSPYVFSRGLIFHFFIPAVAMFPFMIMGMERIFQGKSIKALLISTLVSVLVSGFYMFVYLLVLTVIYAFVRVVFMKEGGFFKRLWKYGRRGGL